MHSHQATLVLICLIYAHRYRDNMSHFEIQDVYSERSKEASGYMYRSAFCFKFKGKRSTTQVCLVEVMLSNPLVYSRCLQLEGAA